MGAFGCFKTRVSLSVGYRSFYVYFLSVDSFTCKVTGRELLTGGSIWRMSVKRTGAIGWRGACDYHLCTMSYAEQKQVLLLAVYVRLCVCPKKRKNY